MGGEVDTIGSDLSAAEARGMLGWWLEAGVDVAIQEEPRNWLKQKPVREARAAEAPLPNVAPPTHDTLAELQQWLATSAQLPLAATGAKRILPQGPENAAVMIITDAPALEDYVAGKPIGGDAWQLAERMLAAIGIKGEDAYSASLSPIHSPGARLSGESQKDAADIARRHISLAKPKRLILFGDKPAQALLGKPLARARGHVHKVEGVRTIATFHPRQLINQPSNKSLAWQDLLLLMEEEA